ncbi:MULTISPECIES: site-specific integrase [Yersinia]|uniref:site-specific integrase n=1 Tax=Yersinia TaxID=629 RepID=UPI001643C05A|nr:MULTISPECIES: tyrosine-type recombinase/integrase [Yersinia]MBW5820583.1 tyrosine-type recombinase/integrase [Yersinia enterocolitica]
MAKRPKKYDANLPRNLTYRRREKSFCWRNPITGSEISLGQVARRDAISQAIQANNYIESTFQPVALLERLQAPAPTPATKAEVNTVARWLKRYSELLKRRELAENTMKMRVLQIGYISQKFGKMPIDTVTTKHIAEFINSYVDDGKSSMALNLRSVLSDVFREAIADGLISSNPVEATRTPSPKVKRERLDYTAFCKIHEAASQQQNWVQLSMALALITGQRRDDVRQLKRSDVHDGKLWVIQGKTGNQIAISLSLRLEIMNTTVGEIIEKCLNDSKSEYLISSSSKSSGRKPGALNADSLTKAFVKALKATDLVYDISPPSFHEIRSLASRLYEAEYGKEFAQKLLGHKSMKMTNVYLDSRKNEWVEI